MATTTQQPPRPNNQLVKPRESLNQMFERLYPQIAKACGKPEIADRLISTAITEVRMSPDLQQSSFLSIVGSTVKAGRLGLEIDRELGQAYLVPYFNKDTKRKEAQLQIGWRGFITLARRSGEVSFISAELVFDCDYLKVTLGGNKELVHVPDYNDESRGTYDPDGRLIGLQGAYAVCKYRDGGIDFEYMPLLDLNRIRSRAQGGRAWTTDEGEMYRKVPIRRLGKRLPLQSEKQQLAMMKAATHDEYVEAGVAESAEFELDVGDAIYQDTQAHAVNAKGLESLAQIKAKHQNPQTPPTEENLDAEPPRSVAEAPTATPSVAQQAQKAQQKVEAQRQVSRTRGKHPFEPDSAPGKEIPGDDDSF